MSRDPKPTCPEKRLLLNEYVSLVDLHSKHVREYAAYAFDAINRDDLERAKARVAESKEKFQDARRRYADHLREHDC
jgi:hypothetical protein